MRSRPTRGLHALANLGAAACFIATMLPLSAQADVQYGVTRRGEHFAVGGIGVDEVARLRVECQAYSLCVRTAAEGSGAYVTDVHLVIADRADGQVVFDQVLGGPWLLIDLKPGAYSLRTSDGHETREQAMEIPSDGHRDAVLRFKLGHDER